MDMKLEEGHVRGGLERREGTVGGGYDEGSVQMHETVKEEI